MARLEAACAQGGSTLFGAGIDPGFVADRVPALLSGMAAEIDQIRITETYDPSRHPVAEFMLTLGFGKEVGELNPNSADLRYWAERFFPAPVDKLARRLGVSLDKIELGGDIEFAFATKDLEIGAGKLRKGTISGLKTSTSGTGTAGPSSDCGGSTTSNALACPSTG
ncbi:hypothetical protein [Sporichthya sp.]|uniref:hypothetical protein n=1 Tax=Sporichthya sp. TaxID=65475 RepID=UPI00260076D2|nr:hypothetical protein [Sporichthya sp.]